MGFHCGNTPACKLCADRAVKYQLIQHRLLEPQIRCQGKVFPWRSTPGILGGIGQGLGLIIRDILNAQELEHLEQRLAVVPRGKRRRN